MKSRRLESGLVAIVVALGFSAGCRGATPTTGRSPAVTADSKVTKETLFSKADLPKLALSKADTPEGMVFQPEVAKYYSDEELFPEMRGRLKELGFTEMYQTAFQAEGYTSEAPVQAPLGQWYLYSVLSRYDDAEGADESVDYIKQQTESGAIPSVVDIRYKREADLGEDGWSSRRTQRYEDGTSVPAVTLSWRMANVVHSFTALGLEPGENLKQLDFDGLKELAEALYKDNLEVAAD